MLTIAQLPPDMDVGNKNCNAEVTKHHHSTSKFYIYRGLLLNQSDI